MKMLGYRKYCLIIVSLILVFFDVRAQSGAWIKKATIPTPRVGSSACVINDKIYVLGGINSSYSDIAANETYDPLTNIWEEKQPLPTPRGFLSSAVVDGIIYAVGGGYPTSTKKLEAYNPVTNTWTPKADMLSPRRGAIAGVVDGIIYNIGGNYSERNCEAYDPNTNIWTSKTPMPVAGGMVSATISNGLIYVFGGGYYASFKSVYVYNPQTDTWTQKQNMPTPRFAFQTYLVNGKIYAIGGTQSEYGVSLATVEVYDPVNDTWETRPDMPFRMAWFSGSVGNDTIYVISGSPDWGATMSHSVWGYYDPALVVPVELSSFTGNVVDGKVLLEWITATELNNHGFEIQRKALSGDFATIAFVKGQGTTTQQNQYSFADKNLNEGKYFYRLKQMDYGGQFS